MELSQKLCFFTLILAAVVLSPNSAGVFKSTDQAKVVRQLVHEADWAAVGSISTNQKTLDYPMVNTLSIADSAKGEASTGNIYFLLNDLDVTAKDLEKNNKMTLLFSRKHFQGFSCDSIDPMSPTCAEAIIIGKVRKMNPTNIDFYYALQSYISRHPEALLWMDVHDFYVCKLDIKNIYVLNWLGVAEEVSVENYYNENS